jgi:alkylation response protein AidB-like acyl-CoA dehydrogenase
MDEQRIARAALEDDERFALDLWKQAADLGWTSPLVPEELGGGCLSAEPIVDLTIVAAEIGRAVGPGPLVETSAALAALPRAT